jgi:hypothetical protein
MSSAVVSTSAASSRLFVVDKEAVPEVGSRSISGHGCALDLTAEGGYPPMSFRRIESTQESHIIRFYQTNIKNQQSKILLAPASRLEIRPAPEMVPSGIPAIDALAGGLPRGCLTEICGPASSGRTSLLLAALAAATRRGEFCAVVDASDALDPCSAASAEVDLDRLLWIRCGENSARTENPPRRHHSTSHQAGSPTGKTFSEDRVNPKHQAEHRLDQVLRATDLLLESGGFGLIVLDLGDLPPQVSRRIPLTTWFRFRRAVEHKPTILLAIEQQPIAGSCSSLLLQLGSQNTQGELMKWEESKSSRETAAHVPPTHTRLLTGLNINAEIIRSRLERKPARSVMFASKTAWAG